MESVNNRSEVQAWAVSPAPNNPSAKAHVGKRFISCGRYNASNAFFVCSFEFAGEVEGDFRKILNLHVQHELGGGEVDFQTVFVAHELEFRPCRDLDTFWGFRILFAPALGGVFLR